jgi:acetyltransferase
MSAKRAAPVAKVERGALRRPLDPFFAPRVIAVVGATERPRSVGRALVENLQSFPGRVFPINPKRASVLGRTAYPAIGDVPEPVDLAVIATPAATVPGLVRQCAAAGVRGVIVVAAGFKESGPEGAERERQILAAAKGKLRILGPTCLGIMVPGHKLNATLAGGMARPGRVALLSQSGALCTAILDWSLREGVGFSAMVSVGGMADVGWGDLIDHLGDDPHTQSIVIYLESIGDARAFLSAARQVAFTKPIVVIKPGRTAAAALAAAAHTGAQTGADAVLDAAFRRAGVLRVDTIEEVFDMAEVLGKQPRPRGPRLAIVTNAGGPAALAADSLVMAGGELAVLAEDTLAALGRTLPAHWSRGATVDILGDADPERFATAVAAAARDPGSDGVLAILTPQAMTDATAIAARLKGFATLEGGKPLLASWMGGAAVEAGEAILNEAGIPTFKYPDRAARAFAHMWRYSAQLQALYETPVLLADGADEAAGTKEAAGVIRTARQRRRTLLEPAEAKRVLAAYDIPMTTRAAGVGGVGISLRSRIDAQLGPILELGGGGPLADRERDTVIGLPPLNSNLALRLLEPTRVFRWLKSSEDERAVAVRRGLETVLVRFSQLIAEQRWIKECELSLVVGPDRPVGVKEARIGLHDAGQREEALPGPAIRPYPQQYATSASLRNGTPVHLRPIRPEDEPLMVRFHGTLSDRSVYYRFFRAMSLEQRASHARLSRLCFVDYARELALVAVAVEPTTGRAEIIGVGRLCREPGLKQAEFAVIVSDRWQGHGLGTRLLARLVEIGRKEGLARITGAILSDNVEMQHVCERVGFTVHRGVDGECSAAIDL